MVSSLLPGVCVQCVFKNAVSHILLNNIYTSAFIITINSSLPSKPHLNSPNPDFYLDLHPIAHVH